MGVKEGLLALLHIAPSHGYQLRGDLEVAVGSMWSVNVGQVYSTLQRLERDGLVVSEGEPDDDGRVPYSLTGRGREEALAWLADPLPRRDDVRDELVLKILLARRTGLIDPIEIVDAQRAASMRSLQDFTRRRSALDAGTDLERVLALDRLALRIRAELDWLDLVEERLARAPDPDIPSTTDATTTPDRTAPRAADPEAAR